MTKALFLHIGATKKDPHPVYGININLPEKQAELHILMTFALIT